jgi:hypothetical protein
MKPNRPSERLPRNGWTPDLRISRGRQTELAGGECHDLLAVATIVTIVLPSECHVGAVAVGTAARASAPTGRRRTGTSPSARRRARCRHPAHDHVDVQSRQSIGSRFLIESYSTAPVDRALAHSGRPFASARADADAQSYSSASSSTRQLPLLFVRIA